MHVFWGESSHRTTGAPARKLWHALHEVDKYLIGQSGWLVNCAKRRRASLRVGTSITEGTANFLVNRRMNKSQQMRWSRRIAMRLQHAKLAASSLSTDEPGRMQAKAFIIEQVERLRWRIWNGNAKNAQIRKLMHVFTGESS